MSLLREYIRVLLVEQDESEAMTQDKVQSIVDRVFPQIMDDRGVGKQGAPKVELHGGIYARYSGVEGMEGELSHSSKAEWVDEDNTIYIYHPNMVNEEDVIRSILHEFEHTHQDPKKYEEKRAEGYDGKTNPYEVDAINAESRWKDYLVDPAEKEPSPLREHIRDLLIEQEEEESTYDQKIKDLFVRQPRQALELAEQVDVDEDLIKKMKQVISSTHEVMRKYLYYAEAYANGEFEYIDAPGYAKGGARAPTSSSQVSPLKIKGDDRDKRLEGVDQARDQIYDTLEEFNDEAGLTEIDEALYELDEVIANPELKKVKRNRRKRHLKTYTPSPRAGQDPRIFPPYKWLVGWAGSPS